MKLEFGENIVLEDSRCKLEPLSVSQHLELLNPISDEYPNLLQYSPSLFGTKENLIHFIETAEKGKLDGNRYAFAIYDKKYNVYAGSTSFLCISIADSRLEIGATWIDKKYQGTGLNSHIKYVMLAYAFEELEAKRVEFRIDARNIRSRKAVEKLGAVLEGELRSHTLLTDGHRRDTCFYGILPNEWKLVKPTLKSKLDG